MEDPSSGGGDAGGRGDSVGHGDRGDGGGCGDGIGGSPLWRPLSNEDRRTLASYEKNINVLFVEEHQLERKAEDVLSSMINGVQFAALLSLGNTILSQRNLSCPAGVGLSFVFIIPFLIGASLAIMLASNKLQKMNSSFENLKKRREKLRNTIDEFTASIKGIANPTNLPAGRASPLDPPPSDIENQFQTPQPSSTLSTEDSKSPKSRLKLLEDSVKNMIKLSNHQFHFRGMLIWTSIGAVIYGLSNFPVIAYFTMCGDGGKVPSHVKAT